MVLFKLCLVFALIVCFPASICAANPKDARNLAIIMGYAGACSKKILGVDHDQEAKPFAQKAFRPYVDMGKPLLHLVNKSLAAGIRAMEKDKGKLCPAVLRTIIAKYEALGFSATIYKKALVRLGNEGMPDKQGKSPFQNKITPGLYISQGKPRTEILLNQDGTGSITGSFASRLKWESAGSRINIFFVDDNNERSRLVRAKILTSSTFELEGRKYKLESDSKTRTYAYAEKGFTGSLRLQKRNAGFIDFEIETINKMYESSCNVRGVCQANGSGLSCKPADAGAEGAIAILNYPGKNITVQSTFSPNTFCSDNVRFTGKYIGK